MAAPLYRVYLRQHDQTVLEDGSTRTRKREKAQEAFAALVGRTDLDGQPLIAILKYDERQLAFHRFDRPSTDNDHWRGRLDEIPWPARGGARPGAGNKLGDETETARVTLPTEIAEKLRELGGGRLSLGIIEAVRRMQQGN